MTGVRTSAVVLVAAAMIWSGCAFTGMRRLAPDHPADVQPRCDGSPVPAVLDFAWSAIYIAQAVFVLAWLYPRVHLDDDQDARRVGRVVGMVPVIGAGIAHAGSGAYGLRDAARCRAATRAYELRVNEEPGR